MLAYIDARDVMKRLDDIVGVDRWSDKYINVEGGFVCELSLDLSTGDDDHRWVTKSNGSNNTKVEPVKGGISSALKRAAVNWGIGRYLYYLPSWCTASNVEQWPAWAKPNSGLENWEDVAELEADVDSGMDEEETVSVQTADYITQIQSVTNEEELVKSLKNVPADQQTLLADVIANKRDTF